MHLYFKIKLINASLFVLHSLFLFLSLVFLFSFFLLHFL